MRRAVPLLTAVVTVIAVGALPFASASASTLTGNPGVTGTRTTSHAISSHAHFVTQSELDQETLCLTNSGTYCAAINPMDVIQVVLENQDQLKVAYDWLKNFLGLGGVEKEIQSEGDEQGDSADTDENNGGEQAGLCLQSTGGNVIFAACGASGTVWIAVPHGNGSYLINRYLYDRGITEVLSVRATINGYHLYVASEGTSGTWQTWTWHPYCCIG